MVTNKSQMQHPVLTQPFASNHPILAFVENVFASVGTVGDLVNRTRILQANFYGYGRQPERMQADMSLP